MLNLEYMSKKKIILGVLVLVLTGGAVLFAYSDRNPAQLQDTKNQVKPVQTETLAAKPASSDVTMPPLPPAPISEPGPPEGTTVSVKSSAESGPAMPTIPVPDCVTKQETTFYCYENYYRDIVKTDGIAAAFGDLKARYPNNGYVQSQCHPITHVIGQAATDKYPKVSEAYVHGDSFCWSGYYHGVMEGIVGKIGRGQLPAKLNSICDGISGKASYSFDYFNCVHGLGHGVMAYTNDELFDSLALCDNIKGGWEQSSCHGGVFMENVIIDNKNHFTKFLKPDEPLYPCTAVDSKYKNDCYLMQTSYMLKVTAGDFGKVFSLCGQVEQQYQATCLQSLGRDASGRSTSNVATTTATCKLGKDSFQKSNCIIGAVKDFISYFHSDKQAAQLCDAQEPDIKTVCQSTAASYYKSF